MCRVLADFAIMVARGFLHRSTAISRFPPTAVHRAVLGGHAGIWLPRSAGLLTGHAVPVASDDLGGNLVDDDPQYALAVAQRLGTAQDLCGLLLEPR